jgi:hypothetical protein
MHWRRHHSGDGLYFCPICNELIKLETAKTNEDGHAVHDECYLAQISGTVAPKSDRRSFFFEKWKEHLRKDCFVRDKERAFDGLGEDVLRSLYESGLEPTVEAIVLNGLKGHSNGARQSDYEKIVDDAVALMRCDYASLQKLFPERGSGGELQLLAFRGFNPQAAEFWQWVRADSKSTCGIALRGKSRVVAPDIGTCNFMAGSDDQRIYLQTGIRACQTTPLMGRGGNVVGMISTHWSTKQQPSEKDFQLFDTLARRAAELIDC